MQESDAAPQADPAFPDHRARVAIAAKNQTIIASLPVADRGRRGTLAATCHRSSRRMALAWDGVTFTAGAWRNGRFMVLSDVDEDVAPRLPPPVLLHQAIAELEIAVARADRDPGVLAEAGAHPAELALAGARPEGIEDPELRGKVAQEIGDAHEHEATAMARQVLGGAPWVAGVRRSTLDEDRRGLDVVVSTVDAGDLYLQVKSSPSAVADYRRKYREAATFPRTAIVVVGPGMPRAEAQGRILAELRRLYKERGGDLPLSAPVNLASTTGPTTGSPMGSPTGTIAAAQTSSQIDNRIAVASGDFSSLSTMTRRQVELMLEAQRIALAREQDKTDRIRITEDVAAAKNALRKVMTFLVGRETSDPGAAAVLAAVRERWPRWASDEFLMSAPAKEGPSSGAVRPQRSKEDEVAESARREQVQRERAALLSRKTEVDREIAGLRSAVGEAKSRAFAKKEFMPPMQFRLMESRLADLKLDSQEIQRKLGELRK